MESNICATLDLIDQALDHAIEGEEREEFVFERFDTRVEEQESIEFERPMLA